MRMPMMAITTNSSISVKPGLVLYVGNRAMKASRQENAQVAGGRRTSGGAFGESTRGRESALDGWRSSPGAYTRAATDCTGAFIRPPATKARLRTRRAGRWSGAAGSVSLV